MRLARLLVPLTFLASYAAAEDGTTTNDSPNVKHSYQVSRGPEYLSRVDRADHCPHRVT